jgi:hypothetical protein
MKQGLLILIGALLLGASVFVGTRKILSCSHETTIMPVDHASRLPELEWLRTWLALDDGQFAEVKQLHLAYLPKCEDLCLRVHQMNQDVLALSRKQSRLDPALAAAIRAHAQLTGECRESLMQHVYETAACLKPDQAKRYLDLMIPSTLGVNCCEALATE